MLDWILAPFTLLGTLLEWVVWLILLPFKIVFGILKLAFGVIAFGIHVAVWIGCIALSLMIARSRGLNPLLCLLLSALLGPVGLLIVIALALVLPSRRAV